MRTEITTKDFKDINRHLERLENNYYDNDNDEEMDNEDDGSDAYEAREYAKEYEQPSYLNNDYYDGT